MDPDMFIYISHRRIIYQSHAMTYRYTFLSVYIYIYIYIYIYNDYAINLLKNPLFILLFLLLLLLD